jgi:hypothetical protein
MSREKNYVAIIKDGKRIQFFRASYYKDYIFLRTQIIILRGYEVLAEKADVDDETLNRISRFEERKVSPICDLVRRVGSGKVKDVQRELDFLCN